MSYDPLMTDELPARVDPEVWSDEQGLCYRCGRFVGVCCLSCAKVCGRLAGELEEHRAYDGRLYCRMCVPACLECGRPNPDDWDANCAECNEKWDWRSMSAYKRM